MISVYSPMTYKIEAETHEVSEKKFQEIDRKHLLFDIEYLDFEGYGYRI